MMLMTQPPVVAVNSSFWQASSPGWLAKLDALSHTQSRNSAFNQDNDEGDELMKLKTQSLPSDEIS